MKGKIQRARLRQSLTFFFMVGFNREIISSLGGRLMELQGLEPEKIYCGATSSQRGSDLPGVSSAPGTVKGMGCPALCSQMGRWRCAPPGTEQLLEDCSSILWLLPQAASTLRVGMGQSPPMSLSWAGISAAGTGAVLVSPESPVLACVGTLGQEQIPSRGTGGSEGKTSIP